jgi:hypothetical protein
MSFFTFRPLIWNVASTPEENRRSRWTFKATWQQTLDLLENEIWLLQKTKKDEEPVRVGAFLFADFQPHDIVKDGSMPRANAKQPPFPGVRVQFESRHGQLTYETDVCEFWQHNVRSIALGLKALRAVDLYGLHGAAEGRQYQGYLALEARSMGKPKPPKFPTAEDALAFLQSEEVSGIAGASGLSTRMLWHHLVTRHHHDSTESPLWPDILEAKAVVEKAGLL